MRPYIRTQIQRCSGVRTDAQKIAPVESVALPTEPDKMLLEICGSIPDQPVIMAALARVVAESQYSVEDHGDGTFTHTFSFPVPDAKVAPLSPK